MEQLLGALKDESIRKATIDPKIQIYSPYICQHCDFGVNRRVIARTVFINHLKSSKHMLKVREAHYRTLKPPLKCLDVNPPTTVVMAQKPKPKPTQNNTPLYILTVVILVEFVRWLNITCEIN